MIDEPPTLRAWPLFDPRPRSVAHRRLVWATLTEVQRDQVRTTIRQNPLFEKRPPDSWLFEGACLALMEQWLASGELVLQDSGEA